MRGGPALLVGVVVVGPVDGVDPQEIVQGVPAGGLLGDEVGAHQLREQGPDLGDGQTGEAGRGRSGDVRAGMQAEQPEQPRRVRRQRPVGPGEHRAYIGTEVTRAERVEKRPAVAQLSGEGAEG